MGYKLLFHYTLVLVYSYCDSDWHFEYVDRDLATSIMLTRNSLVTDDTKEGLAICYLGCSSSSFPYFSTQSDLNYWRTGGLKN